MAEMSRERLIELVQNLREENRQFRGTEQIVRALAAIEAVDLQCYGDCGCVFCGVFDPAGHEPICLWRLAREWVAAQANPVGIA